MKLNVIGSASLSWKKYNEDRCGFSNKAAWVLDGASGLGKNLIANRGSDSHWFVNAISDSLQRGTLLASLGEALEAAVHETRASVESVIEPYDTAQLPSAAFAGVSVYGERLELIVLADCVCMLESRNGLDVFKDERLEPFDREALKEVARYMKDGVPHAEAMMRANATLRLNRQKMNTPEGYWVLNFDGTSLNEALRREEKVEAGQRVLILSDGFEALVSSFEVFDSLTQLYSFVASAGLEELETQLLKAVKADPECRLHPRFSAMDDASALWVEVGEDH